MEVNKSLPYAMQKTQNFLTCTPEGPRHVSCANYAASFASLEAGEGFNVETFQKNFKLEIREMSAERLVLDMVNIDVAFVNALRRILIAEVPTVAIERVYLWQNTGVIQDEVLAHRLGLIPLRVDPELLEWKTEKEEYTEENSIKFRFHVTCTPDEIQPPATSKPVYAKDLVWVPLSEKQKEKFGSNIPAPVEPNILITKLRPGQEIEMELYCEKNIGKVHAKWSPVATAVYRLLPQIEFIQGPLQHQEAQELQHLCPVNVFDVEEGTCVAARPRHCTTCRACIERFPHHINILKNKRHFIFTLESTGAVPAPILFQRAINILKGKASTFRDKIVTALATCRPDEM